MNAKNKAAAGLVLLGVGGYLLSDKNTQKMVFNMVNQLLKAIKDKMDDAEKSKNTEDGIAICEHGVYECPQCITKRLGQGKTKFIEE